MTMSDKASLDIDVKQQLALAIAKLSTRTQLVLALYFQEGCTPAEVGAVLGVTERRVCQILYAATNRLRVQ